jgi:guanylate kinase
MAGETHPSRGGLFVVAGPSGVGKGTVVRRVLEMHPGILLSVSVTTRPARPGETEGADYRFVTDPEFDRLVAEDSFLEWADIFGHHRSGTPAEPVERARAGGRHVILEIDVQGARQVRERAPRAVLIFLAPPSLEELERRLRSRGTEDEAQLARRLAAAGREIAEADWFDHVVVNEQVESAAAEIARIIDESEGNSPRAQRPSHQETNPE